MTMAFGTGGSGLRFPLFGFPVRVEWSFFLIAAFLSLSAAQDYALLTLWVAVLLPSILVHELGHAFAARSLGAEPKIVIHSFGGYTAYVPPREPTRREAIGVSLAGPIAGFGLGALVIIGAMAAGVSTAFDNLNSLDNLERGVSLALYVNLGWGLVNLLPMLPLDGGHVLEQLLPGNPLTRHRRAAMVSIVVSVVAAFVLYQRFDLLFGALFILYFGFQSFQVLSRTQAGSNDHVLSELDAVFARMRANDPTAVDDVERLARQAADPGLRSKLKSVAIDARLARREVAEARRVLDDIAGTVDPSTYALVAFYEGDPTAMTQLTEMFHQSPTPEVIKNYVAVYGVTGRAHEIAPAIAASPHGQNPAVVQLSSEIAHSLGHAAAAQHLAALRAQLPNR